MAQGKIRIRLKGYDHQQLDRSAQQIVDTAQRSGVTPVTVIEAGPCPVVQVKFADADGYDAVQLAFDAVADRKLTRPELGHLAKFKVGAHRRLVEFRGGIDGAVEGEAVTVSIFEP